MVKKGIILSFWVLLFIGTVALMFIAAKVKKEKLCQGINVEITENSRQVYLDTKGIEIEIGENGGKAGKPINEINLKSIESSLSSNVWIKKIKLYFDNNQILQVALTESEPVARIFTKSGKSYYIDSSARYLPTNKNIVARVPVFTSFPSDKKQLSAPDSSLLMQVKNLANFVVSDSFWNAFIAQINIGSDASFQLIPTIGNQIIQFGNSENLKDKFNRLYSFYHQVLNKKGLNKYKEIDVQFAGQVIARSESLSISRSLSPPRIDSIKMDTTARKLIQRVVKSKSVKNNQPIKKSKTTKNLNK